MRLFSAIIIFILSVFSVQGVSIQDAFKNGRIKYSVNGTANGNTGKSIAIEITNLGTSPIDIEIEAGRIFDAQDTLYQDMIVSKKFLAKIPSGQKISDTLFAMCIKPDLSAPDPNTTYNHGKMATGLLMNMIQFVENQQLHNEIGQSLIWNIVRGSDTFFDCDVTPFLFALLRQHFTSNNLLKFEKCKEIPPAAYHVQARPLKTYKGIFMLSLVKTSDIKIGLYDDRGNLIKQFVQTKVNAGKHDYNYEFTNSTLTEGQRYEVRLVVDGILRKTAYIE